MKGENIISLTFKHKEDLTLEDRVLVQSFLNENTL